MKQNKKVKLNISSIIAAVKKIKSIRSQYIKVLLFDALIKAIKPFIPIVLSAKILDELLGIRDINTLIILAATMVGLMLITHILSGWCQKKYSDEYELLIKMYYFEIAKKCMRLDYKEIEKAETIDLIAHINEAGNNHMGIWDIADYMQKGLLAILEIVIAVTIIVTTFANGSSEVVNEDLAFVQSPLLFLGLMLLLLVGIIIYSIAQGRIGKIASDDVKNNVQSNRIFNYLFFRISYNYESGKDIRLYDAQHMLKEKINEYVIPDYNTSREEFVKPNIKYFSLINVVNMVLLTFVYAFIVLKAYAGAITVGAIFIQINSIMRFYQSFGSFLLQYNMMNVASEHFKNSIKFFNMPEMTKTGDKHIDLSADKYEIEFKNVSFKYPSSDDLVLDKINLAITSGERLAVVGMNGAGKTTMIKLLCRMYDPTDGVITLNGTNIKEYDYNEYIKLFSVVFQDFELFAYPLDENIAASTNIDKAKLEKCMKDAGLENVLTGLKGNLSIPMGKNFDENGRDFSGGEKQKTAIARALYKDAPIVVLDEPTAALDPLTEYEIYSKFDTLVGSKAAIFISHRLSSCKFCDNIAVFDKGRIVQFGSHNDLINNENGKYHELWDAQAKHYIVPTKEEALLL